jgi:hypothetical protein
MIGFQMGLRVDPNTKVADHELVFPIPVTQIQLDRNLEQNPDY